DQGNLAASNPVPCAGNHALKYLAETGLPEKWGMGQASRRTMAIKKDLPAGRPFFVSEHHCVNGVVFP
ncbi:MAG: hypothetical protein MUF29_09715, partial [Chitinophagaceae bacterium]|nr:hypothetical protein [Chitinophagaceae bacterium]